MRPETPRASWDLSCDQPSREGEAELPEVSRRSGELKSGEHPQLFDDSEAFQSFLSN